jgi:hypothetical protein
MTAFSKILTCQKFAKDSHLTNRISKVSTDCLEIQLNYCYVVGSFPFIQ